MIYLISFLLLFQIIILYLFVYQSIIQRKRCFKTQSTDRVSFNDFDVIIAAKEDYSIISKCINNVFSVGLNNIILCIDGCTQELYLKVKNDFPSIALLWNSNSLGKIKSQIRCLNVSSKNNVLILDADIVLIKEEINDFFSYFLNLK